MYNTKNITQDLVWVGSSDRRISKFENVFPVDNGVSYNSYLLKDEKTVLFDTVDKAISGRFFENLEHELDGRKLDYIVVHHVEPDHCATLLDVVKKYPEAKVIGNTKTINMIKQFFEMDIVSIAKIVCEGDTISTGKHELTFVFAPMVHWPEVMMTYDKTDKILFSADAFGTFGALNGNVFADEVDFEKEWLPEARRYYTNIVGKYGAQVTGVLRKLSAVEIKMICSLHGPVWRKNVDWYIDKYSKWASYTPEEKGVVIAYGSVYGNTETAVDILASNLADMGVKNIKIYDVSATHPSEILSQCFKYSNIVFASVTYNGGIFCNMETLLNHIKAHNLQNRTIAFMENGSWAPTAGKQMKEICSTIKNTNIIEDIVTIKSSVKPDNRDEIKALAEKIIATM